MPACARCDGPLPDGGTYTPDGSLVCPRCAAMAAITVAEARAAGSPAGTGAPGSARRLAPAWLRPAFLRRHGVVVSLLAGGAALVGAPFGLYAILFVERAAAPVVAGYASLMAASVWAAVVSLDERARVARAARLAAPVDAGTVPGGARAAALGASGPSDAAVAGAVAGPALVAAGCGSVAVGVVVAGVLAFAALAYLFYEFFLKGPAWWNVG